MVAELKNSTSLYSKPEKAAEVLAWVDSKRLERGGTLDLSLAYGEKASEVDKGIQNALMKLTGLQGEYEPQYYYQGLSDVLRYASGPIIDPGDIYKFDQNAMNGLTKAVQVRTAALQTNPVAKFTEDHYAIGTASINMVTNLAFVGLMYGSYLNTITPKTSPMDSDMIDAEIANSNTYNPNAAKAPVTGSQWNNYFCETYGAGNVEWETGAGKVEFKGKIVSQNNSLFDPKAVDKQGRTNIQRMEDDLAPIGYDGKSVNVHHIDQTNNGPVMEISGSDHQQGFSFLHQNTGQSPSLINRNEFNQWRNDYWNWRSNDFK